MADFLPALLSKVMGRENEKLKFRTATFRPVQSVNY